MKICKKVKINTNTFCEQNVKFLNVETGDKLLVCLKAFSGFWFLRLQGAAPPRVEDVVEGLQK